MKSQNNQSAKLSSSSAASTPSSPFWLNPPRSPHKPISVLHKRIVAIGGIDIGGGQGVTNGGRGSDCGVGNGGNCEGGTIQQGQRMKRRNTDGSIDDGDGAGGDRGLNTIAESLFHFAERWRRWWPIHRSISLFYETFWSTRQRPSSSIKLCVATCLLLGLARMVNFRVTTTNSPSVRRYYSGGGVHHGWIRFSSSESSSPHVSKLDSVSPSTFPPSEKEVELLNSLLENSSSPSTFPSSLISDVDDILLWTHDQIQLLLQRRQRQLQQGRRVRVRHGIDHKNTAESSLKQSNLIQITSFGPSGLVIMHRLDQLGLLHDIPAVTIDTLHLFPETYNFIESLQNLYYRNRIDLRIYKPSSLQTKEQFDDEYGEDLWKTNPDQYATLSKVEPTKRAMREMNVLALFTGRRKSQGGERSNLNVFELIEEENVDDDDDNAAFSIVRLRINPLAYWSYDDVWEYIRASHVPYNPLHDRGYKSIGDTMTTTPVGKNADERSGRFVGLNRTECGMHTHIMKVQKAQKDALERGEEFEMPTLPCEQCIDVNDESFRSVVLLGKTDLIVEFYSPMCGACVEFGPKLDRIASSLANSIPDGRIQVVRYDITETFDVPQVGKEAGFKVESTPTLYLVKRKEPDSSPFDIVEYGGAHDVQPIMKWLETSTSYIRAS